MKHSLKQHGSRSRSKVMGLEAAASAMSCEMMGALILKFSVSLVLLIPLDFLYTSDIGAQ